MPIPYETTCSSCGEELSITSRTSYPDGDVCIKVAPCETCMEAAKQQARQEE